MKQQPNLFVHDSCHLGFKAEGGWIITQYIIIISIGIASEGLMTVSDPDCISITLLAITVLSTEKTSQEYILYLKKWELLILSYKGDINEKTHRNNSHRDLFLFKYAFSFLEK